MHRRALQTFGNNMRVPIWQKTKIVDDKNNASVFFEDFVDTLIQQLQLNVSDEGFAIPAATTNQINQIFSDTRIDSQKPQHLLLFNSDTNELNIRDNDGLRKVIPLQNP